MSYREIAQDSNDDYQDLYGDPLPYDAEGVCPACGGLSEEFVERSPRQVCSICRTDWIAENTAVPE